MIAKYLTRNYKPCWTDDEEDYTKEYDAVLNHITKGTKVLSVTDTTVAGVYIDSEVYKLQDKYYSLTTESRTLENGNVEEWKYKLEEVTTEDEVKFEVVEDVVFSHFTKTFKPVDSQEYKELQDYLAELEKVEKTFAPVPIDNIQTEHTIYTDGEYFYRLTEKCEVGEDYVTTAQEYRFTEVFEKTRYSDTYELASKETSNIREDDEFQHLITENGDENSEDFQKITSPNWDRISTVKEWYEDGKFTRVYVTDPWTYYEFQHEPGKGYHFLEVEKRREYVTLYGEEFQGLLAGQFSLNLPIYAEDERDAYEELDYLAGKIDELIQQAYPTATFYKSDYQFSDIRKD